MASFPHSLLKCTALKKITVLQPLCSLVPDGEFSVGISCVYEPDIKKQ
jgi:hypothetical protein